MRGLGALVLVAGLAYGGFVAWITGDDSSLSEGAKGLVWGLTVAGLLCVAAGLAVAGGREPGRAILPYLAAGVLWCAAYAAALALA